MKGDLLKITEALELKNLGFNEICDYHFYGGDTPKKFKGVSEEKRVNSSPNVYTAPTYRQAFKFFRDKFGYHIEIIWDHSENIIWYYVISKIGDLEFENISSYPNNVFSSPEKAEFEGLKKLIEIVKLK